MAYIPQNAYLVYGDQVSLAAVQRMAVTAAHIQWDGDYLESYKIHPSARGWDAKGKQRAVGTDEFAIQLIADADANARTLQLLDQIKHEQE